MRFKVFFIFYLLNVIFILSNATAQNNYDQTWESLDSRPVPDWFTDAKFGIFIHWGVFSVPAWAPADADIGTYAKYAEWYWWRINEDSPAGKLFREYHNETYGEDFKYQDFVNQFTAKHFKPEEWANLFKKAGAKYVVLTSKHVEGFTLWPSAQSSNWNSVDVGPHRDLCGELNTAVKDAGLRMGFYYCLYEWYNPVYNNHFEKYIDERMIPQMKDLVTRYKPDILWADGEWDYPSEKWKSPEFLAWLFNESPVKNSICINDRWGKETRGLHGGYYTTEYGMVHQENNVTYKNRPWEECRGIGTSFGYNRMEDLDNYVSSGELVNLLVKTVADGGNLLLNIGPTADGRIPVIQQQRLLDIGEWLKINADAIYETRRWEGSANNDLGNVFFTRKKNDLYVICTEFPDKPIKISGIKKADGAELLGSDAKVKTKKSRNHIEIFIPEINPANNPCNYAWVFKIKNAL